MNEVKTETDLSKYLPTWYKEVLDYQQIIAAESGQAVTALTLMNRVHNNFFFSHMDVTAISMWEDLLGIIPDLSIDTIEFRRTRLLSRISSKPPFSIRLLREKLDALIGEGSYVLTVDGKNYTMYVESSAENQSYAIEVSYTINAIKPAHIVYIATPYIIDGMLMNEAINTIKWDYQYILGGWDLGVSPFATYEEQGVIKMATTPSIKQQYLNETAEAAMAAVTQARINSSIIITALTKVRSNSTITITYDLIPSVTTLVSKVEFLDASNNVLAASDIYVPITQQTTMKHVINVNEGVI